MFNPRHDPRHPKMSQAIPATIRASSLEMHGPVPTGPAAPVPQFKMRKPPGIRTNPRPYSCDVVNLSTGTRPVTVEHNEKSPRAFVYTRLYERKTPSFFNRQQPRMSQQLSGDSPAIRAILGRSSSQSELEQRLQQQHSHTTDALNRVGSSTSVDHDISGGEKTETRKRAGTDGEIRENRSQEPHNRIKPNDGAGSGSMTPSSGPTAKQGQQQRSARSGESILRRLKFVGSRTASAIAGSGPGSKDSEPSATPAKEMPVTGGFGDSPASGLLNLTDQSASDSGLSDGQQECCRPPAPMSIAYYDCTSLASAWSLGLAPTTLDPPRPTGASQAQSPTEDDPGDGKFSHVLANCPFFRNEMGHEPVRRVALSRNTIGNSGMMGHLASPMETWHREATAAEAGVLENLSNVYLGGRLCAARQPQVLIEATDHGAYYYRHCFAGRAHQNFFGTDETLGPVAVSLVKEKLDEKEAKASGLTATGLYRMIIRLSDLRTLRVAVPEDALPEGCIDKSSRGVIRELLELVCPQLVPSCLRLGLPVPRTEEILLKVDEQPIYTRYKVGVLLCRSGQSTEEQMYNNEFSTTALDEFLELLGQRVRLKGFDSYKGGLDTRGDTTGTHSIYAAYQQQQIMFHVSTMLPYTPSNRQQLSRKRHIGNDMVTVIFQEPGALPFSPITVRSHFQHVFIVVRVNQPCAENTTYTVAVSRAKDVPPFGPPLPPGATYTKSMDFRDFLLTKIINGENAVHRSMKFAAMAARTRREVLKDLAENHATTHGSDGPTRIASRFLGGGGSVKRKEKWIPRPILAECLRGALSWEVEVEDFSRGLSSPCVLGLSADSFVLLQKPTGQVCFATPTHSLIGWASHGNSLKIYYDHGAVIVLRVSDSANREITMLVNRLQAVTKGCEAQELMLRKNPAGQLEFHLQDEGIVTDVEMYGCAWQAGLRQGSRLVEICRVSVSTLSLEQMRDLLKTSNTIRVLVIGPSADGSPRRGCEDPHCSAVKTEEPPPVLNVITQPAAFPAHPPGRQPPSYSEVQRRLVSASPSTRTDQGYESGTWSREEHSERRSTVPEWTLSSLSSEERWRSPAPITDTMSSSGSASSENSGEFQNAPAKRYRQHRPNALKRRGKNNVRSMFLGGDDNARYKSEPNMSNDAMFDTNAPPLPPRTYKNKMATATSVHQQLLQLAIPSTKHLTRAQSEETLLIDRDNVSPPSDDYDIHSARPAMSMMTGQWNTSVVEAAARVLARNPTVGSCQLRLQAALQRVRALEDRVERLTIDLEKERKSRQDLDAEVSTLREDKKRCERERRTAENELRRFTNWVCTAASSNQASMDGDPGAC